MKADNYDWTILATSCRILSVYILDRMVSAVATPTQVLWLRLACFRHSFDLDWGDHTNELWYRRCRERRGPIDLYAQWQQENTVPKWLAEVQMSSVDRLWRGPKFYT